MLNKLKSVSPFFYGLKPFQRLVFIYGAVLLFSFGCKDAQKGTSETAKIPSRPVWGDAVVIGLMAQPATLNPTNYFDEIAENINHQIFQRLLDRSAHPPYGFIPMLAKELPRISDDGLSYSFEIREEAKWDDGQPITGHDVAFSLKTVKNPLVNAPAMRTYFESVKDVVTDPQNAKKFTVLMKEKYPQAENALGYQLLIIPSSVFDPQKRSEKISFDLLNQPETARNHPDVKAFAENYNLPKYDREPQSLNGSNAYQLIEWVNKQKLVLKRKKSWWADSLYHDEALEAFPDQIIYRFFSDENAAIASLKAGELDVLPHITPKAFTELEKNKKVTENYFLSAQPTYAYTYFGMNMKPKPGKNPVFTEKKVRRAMALLFNPDEVIEKLLHGQGKRVPGPILPMQKGAFNENLKPLPYDPAAAQKLLDEAGWKDSDNDGIRDKMFNGKKVNLEFDFQIPAGLEIRKNVALLYQATLKKSGVKMNITPLEPNILYQKQDERDFDMYYGGWAASPAPLDLKQIFHTQAYSAPSGSNSVGLTNPELDKVLDKLRTELDTLKRNQLYHKAQEIIYDEQPYVFFVTSLTPVIISKRFQNATPSALRPNYQPNGFWSVPEMRK